MHNFPAYAVKHEATRYERAEGLSTSIKNPNETISLVEKSTGFLFYAYVFRLSGSFNFRIKFRLRKFGLRKFSNILYYSWKSQNVQPTF